MEAVMAAVDPLPLVPVMWTKRSGAQVAQAGQQCLGTLQARLPAGPGPLMDQFNGFLSCHEGVPPCFK